MDVIKPGDCIMRRNVYSGCALTYADESVRTVNTGEMFVVVEVRRRLDDGPSIFSVRVDVITPDGRRGWFNTIPACWDKVGR